MSEMETKNLAALMDQLKTKTAKISTGGEANFIFDDGDDERNKGILDKDLSALTYIFNGAESPNEVFMLNPIECIPYDAPSYFAISPKVWIWASRV